MLVLNEDVTSTRTLARDVTNATSTIDVKLVGTKLHEEFERSFVRVVYTQLRDAGSIQALSDFQCALQYCAEFPIDVCNMSASERAREREREREREMVGAHSQQLPIV
jgi:hypothetical protein